MSGGDSEAQEKLGNAAGNKYIMIIYFRMRHVGRNSSAAFMVQNQ